MNILCHRDMLIEFIKINKHFHISFEGKFLPEIVSHNHNFYGKGFSDEFSPLSALKPHLYQILLLS